MDRYSPLQQVPHEQDLNMTFGSKHNIMWLPFVRTKTAKASGGQLSSVLHLGQLSVSSSESTQALLEERVDLGLLYGGGQIHGVQRASVLVTSRPRKGERNHWRLLPLRQVVQEGEPHRSVLWAGRGHDG